jgi:DNA-binding GntR family transcriptional regulator
VAESHVPVLEALAARDPERAAAVLRRHIESFAEWVPGPATGTDAEPA